MPPDANREDFLPPGAGAAQATDPDTLTRLFGRPDDLLPLWIAEPYLPLAPPVVAALQGRVGAGWYGYETRPAAVVAAFQDWWRHRHGWETAELAIQVSPSVATSIAAVIDLVTEPGQGVIIQPPVFTDFKPLVRHAERTVVTNPLVLDDGYRMDLDDLADKAADPDTRMLILCNPHNPVGRVWTRSELAAVARICAEHDVVVVSDEIHGDLVLAPHHFTPFATARGATDVRWVATHGPLKTFGLAGVCDTLMITDDAEIHDGFARLSSRLHLTRNNVFGVAAFEAAYRSGSAWLDGLLDLVAGNAEVLAERLPPEVDLVRPEGTYLAWLDLRPLGLDVPTVGRWLVDEARLAVSPGHWFGRQGAGFARMTIAVPEDVVADAAARISAAVERWRRGEPGD